MNAQALAAALAAGDDARAADAVRAWTAEMRERGGDWPAFADALSPLALHDSDKVRRQVADAADLFSDSLFDHVMSRLAKDRDHYVRVAMEGAARRRAAQQTRKTREDAEERVLEGIFEKIAVSHDPQARRRLAERAARRSAELFVRRLQHEMTKVVVPLEMTLGRMKMHAAGATVDRGGVAREIEVAAERVRYLQGILDRAFDATKTVKPRLREECVRDLVEAAKAQLVDRLGERAERLEFAIDVDSALRARLDRAAMLQALQNVLQNGAEAHAPDAERIRLAVSARALRMESELEIVVTDGGCGMDDAQRAKLFVPLESSKGRGSGFGMLVVRNRIEDVHGGTVAIESAPGEGTRVRIVVPMAG
jgi:signal transduction histidine kinase